MLETNNHNQHMLPHEAAKTLGVSVGTLANYVKQNRVRARKTLGGQNRFLRSEIQALADRLINEINEEGEKNNDNK